MISDFTIIIVVIYGILETLEMFGLDKKYKYLIAIPLGIAGAFWGTRCSSIVDCIIYGLFVAYISLGVCRNYYNIRDIFISKDKKNK